MEGKGGSLEHDCNTNLSVDTECVLILSLFVCMHVGVFIKDPVECDVGVILVLVFFFTMIWISWYELNYKK